MDNAYNWLVMHSELMEKIIAVLIPIIGLFLLIQILMYLFLKIILHFKLLKELYPYLFKNIHTLWDMMWSFTYFKLGLEKALWFSIPFYYSNFPKEKFDDKSLYYHTRLIANNKKLLLYIALYFCILIVFAIIIYYLQY